MRTHNGHRLYTTEDKDKPELICDRNGEVVLGLCRDCGAAEIDLGKPCQKTEK